MARDKYDEAIDYLTAHPEQLGEAWYEPCSDDAPEIIAAHCLFQVTSDHKYGDRSRMCGCLTQIRLSEDEDGFQFVAPTPELTAEIRADERIPSKPGDIRLEHLPVFAEWQRRLDKELGR